MINDRYLSSIWPWLLLFSLAAPAPGAEPQTLTLKQAQDIAVKNHPKITASELQVLAAQQVVIQVRSAFFPTLTADATAAGADQNSDRISAGALNSPRVFDRNGEGLILNQLITDFGRTANLTKSSELHARAERQTAIATRAQILLAVGAAYFNVLQAEADVQVAEQAVKTYRFTYEQIQTLAKFKQKSDLDVSFAKVDLEKARILLVKAQNDLKAAWAGFWTVLGYRDEHAYQLIEEPMPGAVPNDPTPLVTDALLNRPELASLRLDSESARRFARAERDLNYPTLSAVGAVGITPVHDPAFPTDHYAAAGVNLSFPIFEGMLFKSREQQAKLLAKKADEDLRDQENTIARDVRVAWLNTNYAFDRLDLTAQLLATANQAFNLAQTRYTNQLGSIVELSQAQLNQTSAQIDETNAKYQYLTQRVLLDFQIGALR
ncbi:MAG: TolC family protein [Verrucomicrobia bacterium]|nr:TolC family protein [Verrucomicrobiota bacterium]